VKSWCFLLIPGSPPAPNLDKSFPLILRIRRYREAWVTKISDFTHDSVNEYRDVPAVRSLDQS
jgi:hypothetical protein